MAFHRNPRISVLAASAGLLVGLDRQVLQYQRYSWDSVVDFLISWFAHYVAVILVVGVAYVITRGDASLLLGRSAALRNLTLDDAMIYGIIIVIVVAVGVFLTAHWVPPDLGE